METSLLFEGSAPFLVNFINHHQVSHTDMSGTGGGGGNSSKDSAGNPTPSLNQPNTEGKLKKKIKEVADLDPKTQRIFERKGYQVEYKISQGAFGKVYTAKDTRKNCMAAVKVMDLTVVSEKFREKFLPREIMMLATVRHPHVIRIFDIFKASKKIYIFMEFAPNGTLSEAIKKEKWLSEEKTKFWFKQCASAIYYMHYQLKPPICHRDVKVENVLLDSNMDAKLSDFGFAKEVTSYDQLSTTYCGTDPYFAPELIEKKPYNPFLADQWAMGVMLFAMINGKFPFHFRELRKNPKIMLTEQKTSAYKYRVEVDGKVSNQVKDLIKHLLDPNKDTRYHAEQMMAHPWLK